LTVQEAWYDHWKHYGNVPDYSHLQQQLRTLVDGGHADEVLELADDL